MDYKKLKYHIKNQENMLSVVEKIVEVFGGTVRNQTKNQRRIVDL